MAQMAGRASVEFYVGLALKGRGERSQGKITEEAFVIRTFRNGLGVFVSKSVPRFWLSLTPSNIFARLGIEGLVMFKRDTKFDAEDYSITIPGDVETKISVFDKVVVGIEVEKDRNTQRGQVKMTLVSPVSSLGL